MVSIIRFSDVARWKLTGPWVLVYGRRKTGKTYFIRNYTEYDRYFFVSRSREIFVDDDKIGYETFLREVSSELKAGKTVVVDEFQRLPDDFLDMLHSLGIQGRLILVSSTLKLTEKYLSGKSPLLGLATGFKMGLIEEGDILKNMMEYVDNPERLVEYSVYLREPWLIPLWEKTKEEFHDAMLENLRITVPSLIGEIFTEEERSLTVVYEAILRNIADGRRVSGEIARQLYSHKVIPAQNPSLIHPYLNILRELRILEKVKIYGKKKYYYYHASPVMDLYYYLDTKYGFSERIVPRQQMKKVLDIKMPSHIEQFMGNLLSKIFGLYREKIIGRDYEVDIALTDFRKLKVVAKVKWRLKLDKDELRRVEEVLGKFKCRKILIVPERDMVGIELENIEVWDVKTIISNL